MGTQPRMTQVPPAPPTSGPGTNPKGSSTTATCGEGSPACTPQHRGPPLPRAGGAAYRPPVGGGSLWQQPTTAPVPSVTLAPYVPLDTLEALTPPDPAPRVTKSYS